MLLPSGSVKGTPGWQGVGSLEKSVGEQGEGRGRGGKDRQAHCCVAQQGLGKEKRQKGRKFLPHLESLPVINSIQLVVSGA